SAAVLKGRPVKFFGIAENMLLPQAQGFQGVLGMPVFVDSLGLMQARYGFQLSPKLPMQVRVVGPSGNIEESEVFEMKKDDIDKALAKNAGFKYDPKDYDAKIASAAASKLTSEKSVAAELSARKAYAGLIQSMGQTFAAGKPAIMQSCKTLVKKHQGTPTADKIDDIYRELGGMEPARKAPAAKE